MSANSNSYPNLFSPLTIRGKTYRNRLIAAPTLFAHSILSIPEIAENVYRMVENRAKGGFAAVATGEISINFDDGIVMFLKEPIDYTKYEGEQFEKMSEYANRIKKHGAIAYLEFSHEGLFVRSDHPYGPCDFDRADGVHVTAMDEVMMQKLCDDTERACRFARACGFDGVLFHGGHGFLFQQFVSPAMNRRTDEYGGSIENRSKFPIRIMEAARRGLGEDGILEIRISAEDGSGKPDAMTIEDTIGFCKCIDGIPDIIQISNGFKETGNSTYTFTDHYDAHGHNAQFSAQVKQNVTKSYVSVIGGFNDPAMCEEVIASGKADFVEMGRQCFADPDLPVKAMMGREAHIRKCVRCFHCYPGPMEHPTDIKFEDLLKDPVRKEEASPAHMGMCALNPKTGFRNYPERLPAPTEAKRVLIIGGGPAGMQAAITAKERGHFVTLAEAGAQLGGKLNVLAVDEDKIDLLNFKELLILETNECGAKILYNTPCSKELIEKEKPDYIIAAVGGHEAMPPIPGIEQAINAEQAYRDELREGMSAILVGGGLVGCETAIYLAGKGVQVTVVEKLDKLAPESYGGYRNAMLTEMDKRGIRQILNAACSSMGKDFVEIECAGDDGAKKTLRADVVYYSLGIHPNRDIVDSIRDMAGNIPVLEAGDCQSVGTVCTSIHGGWKAAMDVV